VEGLHYGFHLERSAPYVAGALLTGLTAVYSFLGHKNFSFRVADSVAPNTAMIDVCRPVESMEERVIAEPVTKAAKRV
jgi:hypothetical protein